MRRTRRFGMDTPTLDAYVTSIPPEGAETTARHSEDPAASRGHPVAVQVASAFFLRYVVVEASGRAADADTHVLEVCSITAHAARYAENTSCRRSHAEAVTSGAKHQSSNRRSHSGVLGSMFA